MGYAVSVVSDETSRISGGAIPEVENQRADITSRLLSEAGRSATIWWRSRSRATRHTCFTERRN